MVTYHDIAKIAEVSPTTVSHVINETRFVAPETKKRVLEVMKQLNYTQPNLLAKSLLTGKSRTIGLVISDIRNPFYPELIQGIEKMIQKEGYNLFLCNTNYDSSAALKSIMALEGHRVDGIIIAASQMDDSMANQVLSICRKIVFIGDYVCNGKKIDKDNIRMDFSKGISEIVDYLVKLGHRDFIFVRGPKGMHTSDIRLKCFEDSVEKHKAKNIRYMIKESSLRIGGGQKVGLEILKVDKLPTAIVCSNDVIAISIMNTLLLNGIKVPQEVSITGLDNIRLSEIVNPPLTTIDLKRYKVGKTAVEMLLKRIKDENLPVQREVLSTELIIRGSSGKAKK